MDKLELPADLPINSALAVRLGTATIFHPFELSKVLMQVGHEPIAPRQSKTLFGTPKLALPSVFQVRVVVLLICVTDNVPLSIAATSGRRTECWGCGGESLPGC